MWRKQACFGGQNLQMMLMNRFCIFPKNKTVNYYMQESVGASRTRQDKIGRWLSPGRWTNILHHDKFTNVDSLSFYELCHLTARRFNELPSAKRPDRAERASGSVRVGEFFARPTERVISPGCGFISVVRVGQSR